MKTMFISVFTICFAFTFLYGQASGAWVDYNDGKAFTGDYVQAVGGNCLIYSSNRSGDSVLAFSTYSHQWYEYTFNKSGLTLNASAGENGAMVWNDSVLVLFDAIHSKFHKLNYDGEMIHSGSPPYNLPGTVGSLTYFLTTEKIYIFDHDDESWSVYAYIPPGINGSMGYAGNGKTDYVMIEVTNHSTSEPKLITFSKSRRVFEEISSLNLEWEILDHGFACWVNKGIPEDEYFFTVYSANHGFMEVVKPNHFFNTYINWNDPIAESTVFMVSYYIPHESAPGGIRHVYAADTRHEAFKYYPFEDSYGGNGTTLWKMNTGFKAGVVTTANIPGYDIQVNFFNGDINDFINAGNSVLRANTAENGYFAGSSYFAAYDTYHLIFNNMTAGAQHTIELPQPSDGYSNPTTIHVNADWGIALCHRALSDSIFIYSFNVNSNTVQAIEEPIYTYDFDKLNSKYYYYCSQAYNDAKKILVYSPNLDTWINLPLASDGQWAFGEDFLCTYDISEGNLKIFDVSGNQYFEFPFGWNNKYNFNKHTYCRDKFLIASNTENHYFGFSSYTRDIKEIAFDFYNTPSSKPGKCMVAILSYRQQLVAYNAKSNSFITKQLDELYGNAVLTFLGDSTLLVVTQNGYLLAFDPNLEATSIKNPKTEFNNIPREFKLAQNFPNPFNPATQIQFTLPKATRIKIEIFNSTGQLVEKLLNEVKPAGTYQIRWRPSELSSGVYFIRAKIEGQSQIRKALLIK
ncbi:MAG TPA: T9SS type A sorting domain-containing protein [Caldithrix abyssi]|uniref:T9SS type A sorting domain-containing protein n=1 Tax=Caldithrix abyssi TaxID=187145 RepID=A0A7V5LK54_CALAY|nr:T9SS type A sorting domain-containing protein [Caldithrix abyssi]